MVKLIVYDKKLIKHVAQGIVEEFEESIKTSGNISVVDNKSVLLTKAFRYAFAKHKLFVRHWPFRSEKGSCFSVLMGTTFEKMFPYCLLSKQRNVYLFDAWPDKHEQILTFLRRSSITNVFFSSQQVTDFVNTQDLKTNAYWIPEGITPAKYSAYDYDRRDIDVLQFGRKYEALHEKIVQPLATQSIKYLYEKEKGKLVFATQDAFVDGLARAKVAICVPSNITHPERAGQISTMTVRYLQAMVSKCLIVGIMPTEMQILFPYTPVIDVDMHNPAGQLKDILRNYHQYEALIERNYQYVCAHHTWSDRWQTIRQIIQSKEPALPLVVQ